MTRKKGRKKVQDQSSNSSTPKPSASLRTNDHIQTNSPAPGGSPRTIFPAAPGVPAADESTGGLKRKRDFKSEQDPDGWQTVTSKRSKKAKKAPGSGSSYPAFTFSQEGRLGSQVKLGDLRDLALYILAEGAAPQWISVRNKHQFRKIVAIQIPGLQEAMFKKDVDFSTFAPALSGAKDHETPTPPNKPDDFYPRPLARDSLPEELQSFADIFPQLWPVKSPGDERMGRVFPPTSTFLTASLTKKEKDDSKKSHLNWKDTRTPISKFLATPEELEQHNYHVHPIFPNGHEKLEGWCYTDISRMDEQFPPNYVVEAGSITEGRKVLAIDCEMVQTAPDNAFSLARISIIDWSGTVVMDELVKPYNEVVDYLTQYSGITPEMLKDVNTTLVDIQRKLQKLITARTILVGHSLESDLNAMKYSHPFIIDTTLLYPHPNGAPMKQKLKFLADRFLKISIQNGDQTGKGHDSVEDAKATLDLTKLKCEKGPKWGVPGVSGVSLFLRLKRLGAHDSHDTTAVSPHAKKGAVVDRGNPRQGPASHADHAFKCDSDDEVVAKVLRAVHGDADGLEIPGGGVDFVFARMRELEEDLGWFRGHKRATTHQRNTSGALGLSGAVGALLHDTFPVPEPQTGPVNPLSTISNPFGQSDLSVGAKIVGHSASHQETFATQELQPQISTQISKISSRVKQIYDSLPACTALIVFSGGGDPRDHRRLSSKQARWRREYNRPGSNWDRLSVEWSEADGEALRQATIVARQGIGFLGVK